MKLDAGYLPDISEAAKKLKILCKEMKNFMV